MRKLSAIMFTDIEGFTKLMQQNEANAVHILERYKEAYHHQTKRYNGRHVKFLGDGTLTIFSSAIQAVNCAIALQQALQAEPIIPVRIGIHQGDVIIENKDVLGDAVNLASRIQPYGISGSILISEKVKDELENQDALSTVALGSFHLKNISHAVNLYAIKADGIKVPDTRTLHKTETTQKEVPTGSNSIPRHRVLTSLRLLPVIFFLLLALSGVWFILNTKANKTDELLKTIAVIPFENLDKDEQNNILASGLTEEMISLLSSNLELTVKKIPANVIGKNDGDLSKLLKDVAAGCILEGKVQHDNDSLFIFVNLRNLSTNQIVWSNTYREKFKNLMAVQEQVALKIANALNTNFNRNNLKNFVLDRTYNTDAYTLYIQGRYALRKRTQQSMQEAIILFNKAIQEDNNFALAYSDMSDAYTILVDNGYISHDSGLSHANSALFRAFLLDSSSAEIRSSKAIFLSTLEGNHLGALKELKLALNISPNYADAHQWYALELAAGGQFDSALLHINKAVSLEPFSERIWANKALILKFARRYTEAVQVLRYSLSRFTDNSPIFYEYLAECYYWLKQRDSTLKYATLSNDNPIRSYTFWNAVFDHDTAKLKITLNTQMSNSSIGSNETLAILCMFMQEHEKALAYIKKAFKEKEFGWLIYINVSPVWDALHKEPAFDTIISKMGLK